MFYLNTDVKANLKLLTITELRSILQARTQTFEKGEYEFTCFIWLRCTAFHII